MLFGGEKIQSQIVTDAQAFAKEKGFLLIFGAMVGGCSKGVQYYDSDYDTRFLYLDLNQKKIFYPWAEKESTLKHRKYFDESVCPYEWIPLWEATSFFQFLKNPAFDGKTSFGLYNIIGWTLQSPYTWDPFGLSAKIMPLANEVFRKDYYIPYHVQEIKKLWTEEKEEIITKDYIYAIYEALCILYADKYNCFPPVYMKTLASALLEGTLLDDIFDMIHTAQEKSELFCKKDRVHDMHTSHTYGMLSRESKYDDLIRLALDKASHIKCENIDEIQLDKQIQKIYKLIDESIYKEQKVMRLME